MPHSKMPKLSVLTWCETTPRHFQLRHGAETLAVLTWPHTFGSLATGIIDNTHYSLKRIGRFGPHVHVTNTQTGEHVAAIGKSSLGDLEHITLETGDAFVIKPVGESDISIEDPQGNPMMTVCNSGTARQMTCVMTTAERSIPHELILLAMLAAYLLELQYESDAAEAVAASVLVPAS
jgi:hypothetical protein